MTIGNSTVTMLGYSGSLPSSDPGVQGQTDEVPEYPVRVHLGAPSCYRASISASKRRTCRRASGYLVRKSMMSAQPSPF